MFKYVYCLTQEHSGFPLILKMNFYLNKGTSDLIISLTWTWWNTEIEFQGQEGELFLLLNTVARNSLLGKGLF